MWNVPFSKLSSICCTYFHTQPPDFFAADAEHASSCTLWWGIPLSSGGWRADMANTQTLTDRESGNERLQNRVINVREEWRLWHVWVVWKMREWFDSRVQDVPIRWIYFLRIDRRLHRHLITHSLHPLFSRHNRTKLHSTYKSFILPEMKQTAENLSVPLHVVCVSVCMRKSVLLFDAYLFW